MEFPTIQASFAVGARSLALRTLASFDAAVNTLCDALPADIGDGELLAACPFFGKVWPSGNALAQTLGDDLRGESVLELGCGLALPSLAAAAAGATVVATDAHPDVPAFLAHNLALNGLEGRVRYEHLDWPLAPRPLGRFSRVLASDCLYAPGHPEALAATILRHLAPGGRAVVADPGRAYLQDFVAAMRRRGMEGALTTDGDVFLLHFKALA